MAGAGVKPHSGSWQRSCGTGFLQSFRLTVSSSVRSLLTSVAVSRDQQKLRAKNSSMHFGHFYVKFQNLHLIHAGPSVTLCGFGPRGYSLLSPAQPPSKCREHLQTHRLSTAQTCAGVEFCARSKQMCVPAHTRHMHTAPHIHPHTRMHTQHRAHTGHTHTYMQTTPHIHPDAHACTHTETHSTHAHMTHTQIPMAPHICPNAHRHTPCTHSYTPLHTHRHIQHTFTCMHMTHKHTDTWMPTHDTHMHTHRYTGTLFKEEISRRNSSPG
jgi:hypothetical protein